MRTSSLLLAVLLTLACLAPPILARPPRTNDKVNDQGLRKELEDKRKQRLLDADKDGQQDAVQEAVFRGYRNVTETLLGRGARLDIFVTAGMGMKDRVHGLLQGDAKLVTATGWEENTALHFAARNGHVEVAKELLDQGADVEAMDRAGMTALALAAEQGHAGLVRLLLMHKADVTTHDCLGTTPLHRAAWSGSVPVVALLVAHGADVNVRDEFDNRPLHVAAQAGQKAVVRFLLTHGAEVSSRNSHDKMPLNMALAREDVYEPFPASRKRRDQRGTVKLLLTHGADPTHVGDDSNSSIHWLLYEGRRDLARLLVQHGAPVTLEQLVELGMIDRVRARLAETQEFPWIPECEAALVVAAAKGNTSIVKLLLDAVDRSGKSIDLDPALAAAVEHGQRRVAALLFDRGADLLQLGDYRRSLLHRAAHAGQVDMVRCLLAGNLNVNYPDRDGITPLHLAAMGGNIGVMAVLINAGAEVNAHDDKGRTPLHLAAERGLKDAVQMFLDHKADANAKDEEGQSPLHLAAKHGHKEATHLLLAAGVDVNAKDKHGVRPLHLVLTEPAERIWMCGNGMEVEMFRVTPPEHLAVAELLLAHKADANATDNQGRPPLEYIHPLVGRKDLAELLMKKGADGAIFVAMRFGDAQRVRDMLKANPDLVAARDSKYGTPLHEAARQGQREMAEVLLAHRADIFARDARGLRPRDLALEAGDVALAKLLGP